MRPSVLVGFAILSAILHAASGLFFTESLVISAGTLNALVALKGLAVLKAAVLGVGGVGLGGLFSSGNNDDHDDDHHGGGYGYSPYGHHDYGYDHHGYGYDPYGHHDHGYGYGHGHHDSYGYGHGHHRRRRDTQVSGPKLEAYLDAIESIDKLGCVPKLVCELQAVPEASLDDEEAKILDLFDKVPVKEMKSAYDRYKYAALIGASGKSTTICSQFYYSCPFEAAVMMAAMKA